MRTLVTWQIPSFLPLDVTALGEPWPPQQCLHFSLFHLLYPLLYLHYFQICYHIIIKSDFQPLFKYVINISNESVGNMVNSFLPSVLPLDVTALGDPCPPQQSVSISLSFIFSSHWFIFITFRSATTPLSSPFSNLLPSTFVSHPSGADCYVLEQIIFTVWDCSPTPNPQPGMTRVSLFVWVITLDLSGMGHPTSSICYRQHSSRVHVTTQAPPLHQSRDTFEGGGHGK